MPTAFYVSTPKFTVLVEVNGKGIISNCAPYLRRTWQGGLWSTLQHVLAQRWGTGLRIHHLQETPRIVVSSRG